jgi:predicted NUDIX family NTP pyrophosphohydrolase
MPKQSAGILLYKITNSGLALFLVHPGGPFFNNKDAGSWGIPKGEITEGEDALEAAIREFKEETGFVVTGEYIPLDPVKLKSGKIVYCWALTADVDPDKLISNTFEIQWPPSSGKMQSYPEVDQGRWFTVDEAQVKINPAQFSFVKQLQGLL